MSKNSGVGFHKFHCIQNNGSYERIGTDIISSIVASLTEVIFFIGIIISFIA